MPRDTLMPLVPYDPTAEDDPDEELHDIDDIIDRILRDDQGPRTPG